MINLLIRSSLFVGLSVCVSALMLFSDIAAATTLEEQISEQEQELRVEGKSIIKKEGKYLQDYKLLTRWNEKYDPEVFQPLTILAEDKIDLFNRNTEEIDGIGRSLRDSGFFYPVDVLGSIDEVNNRMDDLKEPDFLRDEKIALNSISALLELSAVYLGSKLYFTALQWTASTRFETAVIKGLGGAIIGTAIVAGSVHAASLLETYYNYRSEKSKYRDTYKELINQKGTAVTLAGEQLEGYGHENELSAYRSLLLRVSRLIHENLALIYQGSIVDDATSTILNDRIEKNKNGTLTNIRTIDCYNDDHGVDYKFFTTDKSHINYCLDHGGDKCLVVSRLLKPETGQVYLLIPHDPGRLSEAVLPVNSYWLVKHGDNYYLKRRDDMADMPFIRFTHPGVLVDYVRKLTDLYDFYFVDFMELGD